MLMRRSRVTVAAIAAGGLLAVAGCGGSGGTASPNAAGANSGSGDPLTLYSGQHEETTKLLVDDFEKATGIQVNVRPGEDPELANQILKEGSHSPADVFYTENSPALMLLSEKGKLARTKPETRNNVPARFDSPNHDWMGVAGRETVLVYNPDKLPKDELPSSIMDLGKPTWHHKVGIEPSGADFQAIVAAVDAAKGEQQTEQWLQGLKKHGQTYNHAEGIIKAVNRGEIAAGIIYHYDWFRMRAESGDSSVGNTKLHYFGHQDPGAFLSVSGAGVLASSNQKPEARRFVKFLTGKKGQQDLAHSVDFEYPLNPEVPANDKLKPLTKLNVPKITPGEVGDATQAVKLMRQAGML
jgi:iron(III) transport system substrate-binding protein